MVRILLTVGIWFALASSSYGQIQLDLRFRHQQWQPQVYSSCGCYGMQSIPQGSYGGYQQPQFVQQPQQPQFAPQQFPQFVLTFRSDGRTSQLSFERWGDNGGRQYFVCPPEGIVPLQQQGMIVGNGNGNGYRNGGRPRIGEFVQPYGNGNGNGYH